jgi:hypothetical protein
MTLATERFGTVTCESRDTIHFTHGLVEDSHDTQWVLLADQHHPLLYWLQSIMRLERAVPVAAIAAEFGAGRVQLCNSQNLPDWVSRSPVIPLAPMIWEGDDVLIRLTRPIMINPLTREGVEVEASVGQTLQRAWSEKVSTLRECA